MTEASAPHATVDGEDSVTTGSSPEADAERPTDDQPVLDPEVDEPSTDDAQPDSRPEPEDRPEDGPEDELAIAQAALADRTADLQRVQAEFVNYKRRVERDRELTRENATFAALSPIIEVLDTIDRAREHGELDGGFQTVADQLERIVAGRGLTRFGTPGDAFDPTVHEALSHLGEDPDVTVTTCKVVAKSGYKIGDRVVRAAQVLVVDAKPVEPPR